jgi:hypothetical protein
LHLIIAKDVKVSSCRYWKFVLLRTVQFISHLHLSVPLALKFLVLYIFYTILLHAINKYKIIFYSGGSVFILNIVSFNAVQIQNVTLISRAVNLCLINISMCQYHKVISLHIPISVSKFQILH